MTADKFSGSDLNRVLKTPGPLRWAEVLILYRRRIAQRYVAIPIRLKADAARQRLAMRFFRGSRSSCESRLAGVWDWSFSSKESPILARFVLDGRSIFQRYDTEYNGMAPPSSPISMRTSTKAHRPD